MIVLYVGDVMGEVGVEVVEQLLPDIRVAKNVDLVVAQAENVTEGKGISVADFRRLQKAGVDFCTGGNWTLHNKEAIQLLENPEEPIIRPANYPAGTPGKGYKYFDTAEGKVQVVSLLGQIVGKDSQKPVDNPLKVMDKILAGREPGTVATIVNFHGDYSSEKVVIGHYLDGKVSIVVGDHWHVPTNDAQVLPGGTAHQTDVGMCGALDASLGVTYGSIIPRWHDERSTRNTLETFGRRQFNALLVELDDNTGLAKTVEQIRHII